MPLTRSTTAFDRVTVDYAISGDARITWELKNSFTDPLPYDFTLQVSKDGGGDTWTAVGSTVRNTYYAVDDTQRQRGKSLRLAYRVKLVTPLDTYYSELAYPHGLLSLRQWLLARAIIRRAILRPLGLDNFTGYLYKRKLYGTVCTDCVDPITGGILNSDCTTCKGTGKIDGYWLAAENKLFNIQPEGENTSRSDRGTINDVVIAGQMIGIPIINRNDVWIDANSDRRYLIQGVNTAAEINRVPIITAVELRLAEFSDVIYSLDPTAES